MCMRLLQLDRFKAHLQTKPNSSILVLTITSILAFSYNVVHTFMIQEVTAVGTTVIGEVKIVGLILLSYLMLGKVVHAIAANGRVSVDCCIFYCPNG